MGGIRQRRPKLGMWMVSTIVLYSLLLPVVNFIYAPEGNPALGLYLASLIIGLSIAINALCYIRSQRILREAESRPVPEIANTDRLGR